MNYCAAALAPEVIRCRPRAAPFPQFLRPEMELMEFHFTLPPDISTLLIWKQRGGDPGCRAAVLGGLWGQWCSVVRCQPAVPRPNGPSPPVHCPCGGMYRSDSWCEGHHCCQSGGGAGGARGLGAQG